MAKVENQDVPPSFCRDFQALFEVSDRGGITEKILGKSKVLYEPPSKRDQGLLALLAGYTAAWFTDQWKGHPAAAFPEQFFCDRKEDIYSGTFPPDFWHECIRHDDYCEKCFPTVVKPYTKPIAPEYYMESRKPSESYLRRIGTMYPIADVNEAIGKPGPGWEGRVMDGMFRDLYSVQERVQYLLPVSMYKKSKIPLVLVVNATIDATASDRGVASWFTVQHLPQFYHYPGVEILPDVHIVSRWNHAYQPPIDIPDANLYGWHYAYNTRVIRDAKADGVWHKNVACDRVWMRVATPPSQGLYFGRNWEVRVRNTFDIRLYQARYPHA